MPPHSDPELKAIARASLRADDSRSVVERCDGLLIGHAEEHGGDVAGDPGERWVLFERPGAAVAFAEGLHRDMETLRVRDGIDAGYRIGVHVGEIRRSAVSESTEIGAGAGQERRGDSAASPAGEAAEVAERLALLATTGQTLVSGPVATLARAADTDHGGRVWMSHGPYRLGSAKPGLEVVEVGERGLAPLTPPRSGGSEGSPGLGPFIPGRSVGKYDIVEVIGRGGMGVIYRARDTELGRDVALKTLPWSLESRPARLRRFEREVRTLGSLNHPNIVTLHSLELAEGTRFLVMELVEGGSLDENLPEGGMTFPQLRKILSPLCEALTAAHRKGIIHRDLKPSNVMLTTDGRVKVLDFGLAKPLGRTADDSADATTQEGDLLGTMPYMAPERLRGDLGGPESDVFSLGVLVYELATGRRPFPSRGYTVIQEILGGRFDDLSGRRPDLPAWFVDLVHDCLAPEPDSRPADAEEVLARLRDERRTAVATLPSADPPEDPPRKRSRWALAAAAAVALALSGAAFWSARERGAPPETIAETPTAEPAALSTARPKARIAVLPFESRGAEEPDVFAAGLTTEITSRLAAVPDLGVISSRSTARFAGGTESIREIGEILGVDWVVVGEVRWDPVKEENPHVRVTPQLVDVDTESQAWSESLDLRLDDFLGLQAMIAERVMAALNREGVGMSVVESSPPDIDPTAYRHFLRGLYLEAQPDYSPAHRFAVADAYAAAVAADPAFARAWAHLSQACSMLIHLRHDASPDRRKQGVDALLQAAALGGDDPSTHLARATYEYWVERRYGRALDAVEAALVAAPSNAEALAMGAYILRRSGRWDATIERLGRAIALSPGDPSLALQRGATALWMRDLDLAESDLDRAIQLAPHLAASYWYRAWIEWSRGDLAAASRILASMPGPGGDPRVHWYRWRQDMYAGDWDAATARLDDMPEGWVRTIDVVRPVAALRAEVLRASGAPESDVRAAWEAALGPLETALEEAPGDPRLTSSHAVALAGLGRADEARALARRAEELQGDDAYEGPSYTEHRAWVEALLGDHDEAARLLGELVARPSGLSAELIALDPRWVGPLGERIVPTPPGP